MTEREDYITTNEAAGVLGVTRQRVLQLIQDKRLKAEKFASVYMIRRADLSNIEAKPMGRPPKAQANAAKDPAATTAQLNRAFRKTKEAEETGKITKAERGVLKSEAPRQAKKAGKKAGKK